MRRLALQHLQRWKEDQMHRPLLIRGARQVGKTWLVREHGASYENIVEINIEANPEYINVFREAYGKPEELVRTLSLVSGKRIVPGKTLLFFDEVQGSKETLLSLRYFKENLPEQHVIAAGSLLEFAFAELSFPVGRIEFLHLFPLNFEEYLFAREREDLVEAILDADENRPLAQVIHDQLLNEVAIYCLTGGLPEVVKTYVESGDLLRCQDIQQIHVANFREDFHKYASEAKIEYVRLLFASIPRLLGQKFKYSQVDSEIKSRELSTALRLLEQAGLAHIVPHSSANGLPLEAQIHPKKFKVYFLDVGLCQRLLGLELSQQYLERRHLLAHRGKIAEQFVAQELMSFTPKNETPRLYYWHRESKSSQAEVDLLTAYQSSVLPIEVKSHDGGSLRSLHLFRKEKASFMKMALTVSTSHFSRFENIVAFPFYALLKLRHGRI